ncbi:MAG: hypothetical protein KIS94_14750 [Chitinophagales bacterium]|nr:hypothetical protein [Chitinophagales bacterium]
MKTQLQQLILKTALFNFFVVACVGLVLRYMQAYGISFINYKYLLHAHSHYAMGGWMFTALFAAVVSVFKVVNENNVKTYRNIFFLSQAGIAGMLLSFPFQGYGLWSIALSQVYVLATYWFAYRIWRDLRWKLTSVRYLKTALFFLVFSSLGPYAVGPMMVNHLAGSSWYYNAIYFYLHFQYNGWMVFAVFALVFKYLEEKRVIINHRNAYTGWWLMAAACVLTYFLSVLWSKLGLVFNVLGGAGALLQIAALYFTVKALLPYRPLWKSGSSTLVRILTVSAVAAFGVKTILQLLSSLPAIADAAYRYPNFIIAYLHLVFIGFMSFFLFAFFMKKEIMSANRIASVGMLLLFTGFVVTELLLVLQALTAWLGLAPIPSFSYYLFYFSVCMPAGLLLLVSNRLNFSLSDSVITKTTHYETAQHQLP